jgi:hypothetical protein
VRHPYAHAFIVGAPRITDIYGTDGQHNFLEPFVDVVADACVAWLNVIDGKPLVRIALGAPQWTVKGFYFFSALGNRYFFVVLFNQ